MRIPVCLQVATAAAAITLSFNAVGQSNPHNGTWHASFKTANGLPRDGTVVVNDNAGSWDMNVQSRNDPCVGRKFPIAVQKATEDELVLVVEGSKALRGCQDTELDFKAVDGTTLVGSANGVEFTLKKK
jgi:hypothetical protein